MQFSFPQQGRRIVKSNSPIKYKYTHFLTKNKKTLDFISLIGYNNQALFFGEMSELAEGA